MKKKTILSIIALIFFAFIVYFKWVCVSIVTNGDWPFGFSESIKQWLAFPSSWSAINSVGNIDILLWRYPINILYGMFAILGYNFNIASRFLVFWPTLLLGNLSIFYLVRKITKSNIGGVIGAIVFNYQTYFFVAQTAFLLYAAAVWMVIGFTLFLTALENIGNKKTIFLILSGISLFITGSYDFRVAYMGVIVFTLYILFYFLTSYKFVQLKRTIAELLIDITPFVIFGLLNLYWVMPLIRSGSFVSNTILQRGLFGNEFMNVMYAITLSHPFWTGGNIAVFNPQEILPYFWVIPFAAMAGLYFMRKNKDNVFFGLLALLGVFLTKQVGTPFGAIYTFLFQHMPGFSAFREATKFYILAGFGYSVLIGGFVSWLVVHCRNKIIVYGSVVILASVFLVNGYAFISGGTGMATARHIPQAYLTFKNFMLSQNDYARTLWLPAYSRWGYAENNYPALVGIDQITNSWLKESSYNGKISMRHSGLVVGNFMEQKSAKNILSNSSVRYVVVPLEDKANADDFFVYYGEPRQYYIDVLNKIPWIKKINIGTKDLVVYENTAVKPHIYTTQQKETITENIPYTTVESKMLAPYEYDLTLKNVSEPFYLNFSEQYVPKWNVRIGKLNWVESLYKKNYFLSSVDHFQNDAGLNSYYINPKEVCSKYLCIKNPDGTYTIRMELYYTQQSYLNIGFVIMLLTLLGSIGTIIFLVRKGKQHE